MRGSVGRVVLTDYPYAVCWGGGLSPALVIENHVSDNLISMSNIFVSRVVLVTITVISYIHYRHHVHITYLLSPLYHPYLLR